MTGCDNDDKNAIELEIHGFDRDQIGRAEYKCDRHKWWWRLVRHADLDQPVEEDP